MPTAAAPLPTPAERPEANVVIFDGHCRFCTASVQRLARWDGAQRLAFLSLHDPEVAQRYPDLSPDRLMQEMAIVDRAGNRHWGAGAFRFLTRVLPRLWLLAPLLHIPGSLPVWKFFYRQVAQRRYLIAGKNACDGDSCRVHFR